MTRPAHRRALATTAALLAAGLLVASCSSEPEPAPTTALPTEITASESDSGSTTPVGDPNSAAGLACAAYFELDLLNSTYAGGAVADGDMTEEEVKAKFGKLLKELVAQGQIAVSDGSADEKLLANAERIQKTDRIVGKHCNRIRAWRHRRLSVAACVIAKNSKTVRKRWDSEIPHRQVRH